MKSNTLAREIEKGFTLLDDPDSQVAELGKTWNHIGDQIHEGIIAEDSRGNVLKHLLERERKGCAKGGRGLEIATIIAARSIKTNPLQTWSGIIGETKEADEITKVAKATGLWYDEKALFKLAARHYVLADGGESFAWYDEENGRVIKIINPCMSSTILQALDRFTVHNTVFPHTAMELIGFCSAPEWASGPAGGLAFLISQPFIKGREATDQEINSHMKLLGMQKSTDRRYPYGWVNDNYLIDDLHSYTDEDGGNVVITNDGHFAVIDCAAYLNTPKTEGGNGIGLRSYSGIE